MEFADLVWGQRVGKQPGAMQIRSRSMLLQDLTGKLTSKPRASVIRFAAANMQSDHKKTPQMERL